MHTFLVQRDCPPFIQMSRCLRGLLTAVYKVSESSQETSMEYGTLSQWREIREIPEIPEAIYVHTRANAALIRLARDAAQPTHLSADEWIKRTGCVRAVAF